MNPISEYGNANQNTMRYKLNPQKLKSPKRQVIGCGEDVNFQDLLCSVAGNVNS